MRLHPVGGGWDRVHVAIYRIQFAVMRREGCRRSRAICASFCLSDMGVEHPSVSSSDLIIICAYRDLLAFERDANGVACGIARARVEDLIVVDESSES